MVRVTTKIEEKNEFKKRDNTNSMFYFEPADGEYCDVYYLKIMEDDVDDYVWQMNILIADMNGAVLAGKNN